MRHTAGSFELDDDPGRVDRDAVWAFLSQEAYWGRSRSRADLERQLDSAWRLVGAYETGSGRLAGFARAVSDGVAYAYLADVFVVAGARGQGLGTALVETMIDRGPGRASAGACTPPTRTGCTRSSASPAPTSPTWSGHRGDGPRPGRARARPARDGSGRGLGDAPALTPGHGHG